jgi:hypothetical protein
MADSRTGASGTPTTVGPTASLPPGKPLGRRIRNWFLGLLLLALVAAALYMVFALKFTYSTGDRAGIVQKFSNKGWVCKTWEGELAMTTLPGAVPEVFRFTVRDEAVSKEISATMGQHVVLGYDQHFGLPSCFGETSYVVTSVRINENPGIPQAMPQGR